MILRTPFCAIHSHTMVLSFALCISLSQSALAEDGRYDTLPSTGAKATASQLRDVAAAAEKGGDWEAAFAAYCRLYAFDRSEPDVREKLNISLRRAQQLRRHREPQFQRFAAATSFSDALSLFGEVVTKVPGLYADRDRATPQKLWQSAVEELSRALGSAAFREAFLDAPLAEKGKAKEKLESLRMSLRSWAKQPIADGQVARTTLRKLISTVQESFEVRSPSALTLEMVYGACGGLDEYTFFISPTQLGLDSAAAIPDLSAQGIYLAFASGECIVSGIASGSWAAHHTTLQKGDRIVSINGRSMEMATLTIAAEALRKASDGAHQLEIASEQSESASSTVQLPTAVPTVYGIRALKEGIGYARIGSFSASTPRELDEAIHVLRNQSGVRVLILDLRGNLGGSFLASVETARRFIPSGPIVSTQGQLNEVANQSFSSASGMAAHDIPVVLLIDGETASAAEVLAAALKDNNRASLIGMPTFGKGAIQYPLKLASLDEADEHGKGRSNRSGTVRLTIAKLIAPRSGTIDGVGISPHQLEADPDRQVQIAIEKANELLPMAPRQMMP